MHPGGISHGEGPTTCLFSEAPWPWEVTGHHLFLLCPQALLAAGPRKPDFMLHIPGFSVPLHKRQTCSGGSHHHPQDPKSLLRLCVQYLGAEAWGWSAGQEAMTWLPQWLGGGQHGFHRHSSRAPDSSVPKLALAISNFDISSGNHVAGMSVFKIRVALTFLSPCLCGQAGEIWKTPSGSAVLVLRAHEEAPHWAGVLPSQVLGVKDPVPPGAGD